MNKTVGICQRERVRGKAHTWGVIELSGGHRLNGCQLTGQLSVELPPRRFMRKVAGEEVYVSTEIGSK